MITQILQILLDVAIVVLLIINVEDNRKAHGFIETLMEAEYGLIDAKLVKRDGGFDIVYQEDDSDGSAEIH